jgi:UDP-N-acetylmuramate--alanine ligase
VWQPHTFSRTQTLQDDYVTAISQSDLVVITEIFAAREKSTGFSSSKIVEKVQNIPAIFAPTLEFASIYLQEKLLSGDVVLVLSAGDAIQINQDLIKSPILSGLAEKRKAVSK